MGFVVRPTEWEVQHAGGIFASQAYQAGHGGQLPDTPMWRMLEFRYDLNAARFAFYHPNVARMIEQKLLAPPTSDATPPVAPPVTPPIAPPLPITPPAPPPITPPITPPLPITPPVTPPITPPTPPPDGGGGQIITPPGPDTGGGGVVPEPSSITMLLVAVVVLGTFCLHLTKRGKREARKEGAAAVGRKTAAEKSA